jgi:acyl-CoA thioesterase-1
MTARIGPDRRTFMSLIPRIFTALVALAAFSAFAAPDPAEIASVEDDPALPRVLLIGDSISIGYTLTVREALKKEANVHRIPTNGGPTSKGLLYIDAWLGEEPWDIIHFNWGLHDLKRINADQKPDKTQEPQVPLEAYRDNLESLVNRMKVTGATLIWASTTTVPEGEPMRRVGDDHAYNAVAAEVMKAHEIVINDLQVVAREKCADHHTSSGNVHFTEEGSRILGEAVATSIRAVLAQPATEGAAVAAP